jgi:hypothetical protein
MTTTALLEELLRTAKEQEAALQKELKWLQAQ